MCDGSEVKILFETVLMKRGSLDMSRRDLSDEMQDDFSSSTCGKGSSWDWWMRMSLGILKEGGVVNYGYYPKRLASRVCLHLFSSKNIIYTRSILYLKQ